MNPSNADFYLQKGIILRELGNNPESITAIDKAISLNSDNELSKSHEIITLKEQGNNAKWVTDLNDAVSLRLEKAECYLQKGITLRELGKNAESITAFDKAMLLKPNFVNADYNKNITLKVMGDRIVHDEVTTLNPNYPYTETYNNTDLTFYGENVLLVGDMF